MNDDETTSASSEEEDIEIVGTDNPADPDQATKIDLANDNENLAVKGTDDDHPCAAPRSQGSSSPDISLQELTRTIRGASKQSADAETGHRTPRQAEHLASQRRKGEITARSPFLQRQKPSISRSSYSQKRVRVVHDPQSSNANRPESVTSAQKFRIRPGKRAQPSQGNTLPSKRQQRISHVNHPTDLHLHETSGAVKAADNVTSAIEYPEGGTNEQVSPGFSYVENENRDDPGVQQSPSHVQEPCLADQRHHFEEGLIPVSPQRPPVQSGRLPSIPPRNSSMTLNAIEELHIESPLETKQQTQLRALQQQRAQAEASYAISQQAAMDWTSELDQSIRRQNNARQQLSQAREDGVLWKTEWNRVDQEIAQLFNSESQPHPHQTAPEPYASAQFLVQKQNVVQQQLQAGPNARQFSPVPVKNTSPAEDSQVPDVLHQEQTTEGRGQLGQEHLVSSPQPRNISMGNIGLPEGRVAHETIQSTAEKLLSQASIPVSRIPRGTGHWRRTSTIAPSSLAPQVSAAMPTYRSSIHDLPSPSSEARASKRTRTNTQPAQQRTSQFSEPREFRPVQRSLTSSHSRAESPQTDPHPAERAGLFDSLPIGPWTSPSNPQQQGRGGRK
ncbi:MAG: hypothetical protein Q9157_001876 [Trypethelium eluteriae]